jgi:hypothetical protein
MSAARTITGRDEKAFQKLAVVVVTTTEFRQSLSFN